MSPRVAQFGVASLLAASALAAPAIVWHTDVEVVTKIVHVAPGAAAPTAAAAPAAAPVAVQIPKVQAEAPAAAPAAAPATAHLTTGSSSTSGTAQSGTKRGLLFNDISYLEKFETSDKFTWSANWVSDIDGGLPSALYADGTKYVSQLHDLTAASGLVPIWALQAAQSLTAGSDALMYLNEPDLEGTDYCTPATAAQGWMANMEQFHGKATLVGPAVTNGVTNGDGSAMGLTWLQQFFDACTDCHVDACGIHWYDQATNFDSFQQHLEDAKSTCGDREIWVNEFGSYGSDEQQAAFLKQAIPLLEGDSKVARYAYFKAETYGPLVSAVLTS